MPHIATSRAEFDGPYLASRSDAIRSMIAKIRAVELPTPEGASIQMQRLIIAETTANELIAAGRTDPLDLVDNPIMVWLWSPFDVMSSLVAQGFKTVLDGTGKYSIPVSLDLDDYPPYQETA
jgi:hypothetical protein